MYTVWANRSFSSLWLQEGEKCPESLDGPIEEAEILLSRIESEDNDTVIAEFEKVRSVVLAITKGMERRNDEG